jgi:hypothetical protein
VLQKPDQWGEDDEEDPYRTGENERRALWMVECDSLRDELTDHHLRKRDQQEREPDREHGRERRLERVREHRLAERTDPERSDRDPELHRSDEPRRIGRDAQNRPGTLAALALELTDPCPARDDKAVLARDKHGVQKDQSRNTQKLKEENHASRPNRGTLAVPSDIGFSQPSAWSRSTHTSLAEP